jgi:drug/metabolite transporter (DMT)-like permease
MDYKGVGVRFTKLTPVLGLLTGATVWGLIWYPYRALEQAGIAGDLAATLSYALALIPALVLFRRRLALRQVTPALIATGLSAGWANIGFTWAVIYGDVMRVVLLFYLAPVWTMLCARLLLDEKLNLAGYGLMLLAFGGAVVMLWDPRMHLPLPQSAAEWIGLSAGMMFALSNVLARRLAATAVEARVIAVFAGGAVLGACSVALNTPAPVIWGALGANAGLVLLLALVIFSVNLAVQHGLANVAANRAIVIYLFELVVTALSTWLLAGETLSAKEWLGGAMIIAAGLWSERPAARPADSSMSPG